MLKHKSVLTGIAWVLLFGAGTTPRWESLMAQEQPNENELERAARAASVADPQSIRSLGALTLAAMPVHFHPDLAVSERLFRSELAFRQGGRAGISAAELAAALNVLCAAEGIPDMTTTARQVQTYRTLLMVAYPSLVGERYDSQKRAPGASFGPLQALFVGINLLHLKATEPSYKIDPDVWAQQVDLLRQARSEAREAPSRKVEFVVRPSAAAAPPQYQRLLEALSDNAGDAVQSFLKFLSGIGVD